jgi:catechol 2,3-dioxygenase-like lactoylglutathione lyase family enzyme
MSNHNDAVILIFYVKNQEESKKFYQELLGYEPRLDVPGMTEFQLTDQVIVGLMPEKGIVRILEGNIPDPALANGIPRSELYLYVDEPEEYYERLVASGGTGISRTLLRNWGDTVAYGADLDGHILAFARKKA